MESKQVQDKGNVLEIFTISFTLLLITISYANY